jgi:hypothetical protein
VLKLLKLHRCGNIEFAFGDSNPPNFGVGVGGAN